MIFSGELKGADVSFYQDDNSTPQQINFNKMVEVGADYVIIRAGQNTWIDGDFQHNWWKAKEAELPRAAYWFYDSRADPVRQADIFASLFQSDPPELELWLDLEEHYGGQWGGYLNWKKFLVRLKQLLPQARIGIYTGYHYINGRIPQSEFSFFAQFVLWLAWYTQDSTGAFTPIPSGVKTPQPWTTCLYWQWGTPSWGLEWGCESREIDMNLFNGTREQFNLRYFGESMPYIELKPNISTEYRSVRGDTNYPVTPHIYGSTTINNRILSGNYAKADPINFYEYTADVYVGGVLAAKANDKWWRIYEANGVPMEGWVAERHKGVVYLNVRLVDNTSEVFLTHTIQVFSDGSINVDGNPVP